MPRAATSWRRCGPGSGKTTLLMALKGRGYVNVEPSAERDQTFAGAERVFNAATRWYRRCGHACLEVPLGTIEERCDFVISHLE